MPMTADLVADFYSRDPLLGEDARLNLTKSGSPDAIIEALIPLEGGSYGSSPQIEARLKAVAAALGPQIVPHLTRVISSGPWGSKLLAAPCFAGLEASDETQEALINILKAGGNFDAERLSIEALGFLGADAWAYSLVDYAKGGQWQSRRSDYAPDRVDRYSFGKLGSYVLEALARFAAKCSDRDQGRGLFDLLTEFLELYQLESPNVAPSAVQLVGRHGSEFTSRSVDHLISVWGGQSEERIQRLCMDILAYIAPLRAAKFLLETAISPSVSYRVRIGASIALGEIRHPHAAQRLAAAMKEPSTDKTSLDWAFSTLYAMPADWVGVSDYVDGLLAQSSEPANQLRYSLALKGDDRCQADLIDHLDDHEPFNRWTAALALVRLLGSDSLNYLEGRAEEAGDDLERCAMYAAVVRAGAEDKARDLHSALQAVVSLPRLRSVWKLEILDAFHTARSFDARAFPLWRMALEAGAHQVQYLEGISAQRVPPSGTNTIALPLKPDSGRTKLFVSYSRRDGEWLKDFQRMLSPLIRNERLSLWADTEITPGKWRPQIEKAMAECHVALFLVSENFLASDFIMKHELPDLLRYADERDVTILWVLLDDCLWEESALSDYQAENAEQPLSRITPDERKQAIKDICMKIRALLNVDS